MSDTEIEVELDEEEYEYIQKQADALGISFNDMVTRMLYSYLRKSEEESEGLDTE
mgnify:FL=1